MGREEEIKLIAYNIWEQEGCADGRDYEDWFRAEVIWERQQKQRDVIQSIEVDSKKAVKQNTKTKGGKKK
jgi:hypothetical protein